jgi:two-component system cell cycle sensor histidine kinase/response regulator CckA
MEQPAKPRSLVFRYGLAVVAVGVILGVSLLLQQFEVRLNLTLLVFFGLVVVTWYAGRGPGILLAVLVQIVVLLLQPLPTDDSLPRALFAHFSVFALLVFMVLLVSSRKSVEQRLRDQGELFRITLSSIGDAVIATDSHGKISFINPTAERLTGWNSEDAQQKFLAEVYRVVDEHTNEPVPDMFETVREKLDMVLFNKDIAIIDRDGGLVPILDSGAPILDEKHEFKGAVVVFQDVSERRKAEQALAETEGRLRQSQKLEAVGTMTGGVAHDFNNLLTAILGYRELASRRLEPGHPSQDYLVNIEKAATRAAELTKKLLAFSRRQKLERRVIDLNDSIAEILNLLERVIGADIRVTFKPANDLKAVYADPVQIEQVIMNLSVNARDAMPSGGKLLIETYNVELDEYYCRRYPNCTPGRYAQISVSDTGMGMSSETVERIFDPFFTTKDVNKGTGLGLSTVYGIVRQHGGIINVYSEPSRGTTFKLFLPIVDSAIENMDGDELAELRGGPETILVAEDEEALRVLSNDVLSALGYNVISASNGEEAVALYKEHGDKIDLLLFDVVMPGMGGPEAFRKIRDLGGGTTPLLFMTGYSSEILDGSQDGTVSDISGTTVIQKPYTLDRLGREVRTALDSTKTTIS